MPGAEITEPARLRVDESGTELVGRARSRALVRLPRTQEAVALLLSGAFVLAALSAWIFLPAVRPFSPGSALVAVAVYAAVAQIRFEVSNGFVLPTQLVLVPLLFTLPPRSLPLLVAAAFLVGETPSLARRRLQLSHAPVLLFNAAHTLGPSLVLSLADARAPTWHDTPLYLAALAAQFAADFLPGAIWSRAAYGIPLSEHARSMRMPQLVDTALAPIGLAVAIAAGTRLWAVLVVLPLVWLLKVFAREREVRLDHALELSHAYRGTAMLLGDVIEADDAYTGSHSRDVVELVLAVADRLALSPRERKQAEFAALLHDVGKIKIPAEIINKPGPLDDQERALINTHTILGEQMLNRVGGLLGEVGQIVRSCHERWDGTGYPDRLAGTQIPLAARIVCACDAWSAITTDRSYRRARTTAEAAAELRTNAGTHFDPTVIDALLTILETG
jgi:HD-GYP domain-containing protein (c-di-GMP phosphodiesterase class II)